MPGSPCPIPGPQLHRVRMYSAAHGLIRRSSSSIRTDVMPPCSQSSFTCVLHGSELQACPPHTPRVLLASPPATSVRPTRLSLVLTRGPSCAPLLPTLTLVATESGRTGLAGQGVQGPAVVGARFTEPAGSLLGDPEATSIQGLRAPGAHTWMGTAGGAVVGKHAAAQTESRPQFHDDGSVLWLLVSPVEPDLPQAWALNW